MYQMKSLFEYIEEAPKNSLFNEHILEKHTVYDVDMMFEGIVIDNENMTVKLDDSDRGINFNGPIYWETSEGQEVISIFKRKKIENNIYDKDGNPFIYALKNIKGWKFDISDTEIHKYLRKFISNCKQIQQKYDTIITIPSGNFLNKRFMRSLANSINAKYQIEDLITKIEMDYDEPEDFINYNLIKKDYPNNSREIEMELEKHLYKLNNQKKEFKAKDVKKKYLKYFNFLSLNNCEDAAEKINDKNIIVLDDIFSSGATVSQAIEAIKQNYEPKSMTVITLLSKRYD